MKEAHPFSRILNMKITYGNLLLATLSFISCSVLSGTDMPRPYPAPESGTRLTPTIGDKPSINGARIFGVRPNYPIDLKIATSGKAPLSFSSPNLPEGLSLDLKNGRLTGTLKEPGRYAIKINAKNSHGEDEKTITLVAEDNALCLTPPMGWNSWYSYSESISQEAILKTARRLVDLGLTSHGWTYVNIDDCWQGKRGGPLNAIQPNHRFPDMKAMCDEIHALGLKAGIYSTPWIGSYAGFIGSSSPNEKDDVSDLVIPVAERTQPDQVFGRYPGLHKQKVDRKGSVWRMDEDARQWAEWGIDYIKVDWNPNDVATTKQIKESLDKSGRPIILSLSNATPMGEAEEISRIANLWRTTGDIHDSWDSIKGIGFSQEPWQKFMKQGHWNDPDMLQIGRLGKPNNQNTTFVPTNLTPDEQYTQVSLWSLLSAPLIISCDLENMDDFTLGLLTNDEVIAVNQDPAAHPAQKKKEDKGFQVWTKKLEDDSIAVGIFNLNDEKAVFEVNLKDLSLSGLQHVRDLWKMLDVGTITDTLSVEVNPHGCTLLRLEAAK